MKRVFFYIVIVFSLLVLKARAQNLVLNPSFENLTIDCCDYPLGTNPYLMLKYWTNSTIFSTCDLAHRCLSCAIPSYSLPQNAPLGYQIPRSGDGFCFFRFYLVNGSTLQDETEYPQGVFLSPLQANREYKISFWVSLADDVNYSFSNLAVYLSDTLLAESAWILNNFTPQLNWNTYITEREDWERIEFNYTAHGGERYFTLGNFKNFDQIDTFKLYCVGYNPPFFNGYDEGSLYLDDVAIYPADAPVYAADAGGDQLLCNGESIALGSPSRSQYLYWWYDAEGNLIDTTAQITVSPDSSTYYVLQQKDFKFDETSDTVFVYVSDCESPLYIPNIFSPNGDGQNDIFRVRGEGISEIKTFIVYNRWGQEVFSCHTSSRLPSGPLSVTSSECGWDGTFRGQEAPEGVYSYYVEAVLLNGQTVMKKGNVTLVR